MRLKRKCCVRLRIVAGSLSGSVVARINFTYSGGSSNVLSNALKASRVSICTSSMIKILKRPILGWYFVCSIKSLISSILRLDAPSSSIISIWLILCGFAAMQFGHSPQGLEQGPLSHCKALAKILALEVFPLPRNPENK